MEIEFNTNRLERCFDDLGEATREWCPIVARRYIDRIYNIQRTDYFRELFNFRLGGYTRCTENTQASSPYT